MEYIENRARKKAITGLRTVIMIALTTFIAVFIILSNYNINEQQREIKTRIQQMQKDIARQNELLDSISVSSSIYIERKGQD